MRTGRIDCSLRGGSSREKSGFLVSSTAGDGLAFGWNLEERVPDPGGLIAMIIEIEGMLVCCVKVKFILDVVTLQGSS